MSNTVSRGSRPSAYRCQRVQSGLAVTSTHGTVLMSRLYRLGAMLLKVDGVLQRLFVRNHAPSKLSRHALCDAVVRLVRNTKRPYNTLSLRQDTPLELLLHLSIRQFGVKPWIVAVP